MTDMTNQQREAFEAAMAASGYELNPPIYRDGTYRFAHYAAGWEMWQAATAAERARCAKVCEAHQVPVGNSAAGEMAADWTMDALREVRDAILAG